jgi:hypothetical protein
MKLGIVRNACAENVSEVTAQGAPATLELYAKRGGACDLDLYDTMLVNSAEQTVDHTIANGRFST